jgi:hypothetical protein
MYTLVLTCVLVGWAFKLTNINFRNGRLRKSRKSLPDSEEALFSALLDKNLWKHRGMVGLWIMDRVCVNGRWKPSSPCVAKTEVACINILLRSWPGLRRQVPKNKKSGCTPSKMTSWFPLFPLGIRKDSCKNSNRRRRWRVTPSKQRLAHTRCVSLVWRGYKHTVLQVLCISHTSA